MSSRRNFLTGTLALGALRAQAKQTKPAAPVLPAPAKPKLSWDPKTTWVFAVGVLVYPDGQAWPDEGRQDAVMIDELKKCGVPSAQVTFIKDKSATLADVQKNFDAFLKKAPANATLWFYFAGHGDKNKSGTGQFVLYDKEWSIPQVLSSIEKNFPGKSAMLFADCCYSGSLGMEALLRAGRVSCGALASSLSSTISTGQWTFTECLVAALRGELRVDADGDGNVTFLELARYAEREMAMNDEQLSTFVAANGFDASIILRTGTKKEDPRIGEYVEGKSKDGKYYLGRIDKADASSYFIKWVGYPETDNEWVKVADTRAYVPKQYTSGKKVQVEWKKKWYPAEVITGRLGMHFIHYTDFEEVWDEWVSSERIKSA